MLVYLKERLEMGRSKYGHGVRVNSDTMTWGTSKNSWLEMTREEALDGIIYTIADYIREHLPDRLVTVDDNDLILHLWQNQTDICSDKHCKILQNFTCILVHTF